MDRFFFFNQRPAISPPVIFRHGSVILPWMDGTIATTKVRQISANCVRQAGFISPYQHLNTTKYRSINSTFVIREEPGNGHFASASDERTTSARNSGVDGSAFASRGASSSPDNTPTAGALAHGEPSDGALATARNASRQSDDNRELV